MDKNEYRAKLDEINDLVDRQDYKGALKIVDTIDWRRVRSARTLCMVGEIYEANKRYNESRKLLLLAHQRAPIGKTVLYRLVELSIKMGDFDEAIEYYKRFVEISPNDNSRYILKYKIYRARRSPIEDQISILQEYKAREYTERWAYELARLYAKAGMTEACVEECDDLILWFSEGKYVVKAMELKMKYTPLTPGQQEKYDNRFTNSPSAAATAVASAVTAATEAAAKVVEKAGVPTAPEMSLESQDKEIEAILNSIVIGDMSEAPAEGAEEQKQAEIPESAPETLPIFSPNLEQPEDLQDKVAQGIRDVFQGRGFAAEEDEAAAAREPAETISPEEKGYVIKELEPENIQKAGGFKPFHTGGNITMEVKAEAPKSKMFREGDFDAGAFKTDMKEREFDLDQLLAETASELAQAVAEETKEETPQQENAQEQPDETADAGEAAAGQAKETALEKADTEQEKAEKAAKKAAEQAEKAKIIEGLFGKKPSEAAEEPAEESQQTEEIRETAKAPELTAPAAARAAIVAENLTAAFADKAEAFEAFAAADLKTAEPEIREEAEEKISEEKAEKVQKEIPGDIKENVSEETPEEILEDVSREASKEILEDNSENISGEASEDILEDNSENVSEEASEDILEDDSENVSGEASENILEDNSENVSGEASEDILEDISENVSEKASENILEDISENVSDVIPQEIQETVSQPIPESISEDIAEKISKGNTAADGATKEFPIEDVRQALEEVSLSEVPEHELTQPASSEKEEPHMKRFTGSVASENHRKSMAFNAAVEGLMRHHLTEEEHRRLFTYFAPIPGMTQQINEALDIAQESACEKTSQAGNFIVTGREGSGKTRLSEGLIKALCKERQMEGAKVAYVTAEQLNKKDPVAVVGKLAGGFLVVENAGALDAGIVENMSKAMEFKTNRLTVILEDLKPGIRALEEKYPEFTKKFDSRIAIPVFTNDELVSFAKTYAKELGYKIDDMAVLALYTLIGDNQNEENPVAIGMVREMMDDAIKTASRKGRKAGKRVGKRHLDESGRIMLYEKDFDI